MIEFFAILFIVFILGVIISIASAFITQDTRWGALVCVCLVLAWLCGIGMEAEKAKEPKVCECACCSACETEVSREEIKQCPNL